MMDENVVKTAVAGDILLTQFGVAVVIRNLTSSSDNSRSYRKNEEGFFLARLWRVPGKSIGSSATAFLRCDSIIKHLPAAPGMVTTQLTKSECGTNAEKKEENNESKIMVHCYSASNDKYLVSSVVEESELVGSFEYRRKDSIISISDSSTSSNNYEDRESCGTDRRYSLVEVGPSEIATAPSAKFYPLIHDLIIRGNRAANSATVAIRNNASLSSLASKSNDSEDVEGRKSIISALSKEVGDNESSLKNVLPSTDEVKDVYKMLKDEELTVLLEKGRMRLRQLVSSSISEDTENSLREMGVEIKQVSSDSSMIDAMLKAQTKALDALDILFKENVDVDIETIKTSLGDQFATMFDSLSTAAKSDSVLSSIFEDINSKTSEWQEQTGRLLSTRSASLFFEGAQRLQARVSNLISPQQLSWLEQSGAKLTKAFTEGDAALTRLKSVELGETIRARLIKAIEIRSDSDGGLDGIIAGALSKIDGSDLPRGTESGVQSMLSQLQNSASEKTKNTRESLISMLSQKSQYHNLAIIRIERVLVDLEPQLGDDLSAEQIASIARGDGGTAALFEPIARKAATEIEKQLDAAESSVEDPTILSVLSHIRKITSGELTVNGLVSELANILNDDDVVNAGETFAKEGERILDVIENVSGNKVVGEIMEVAEKAGLTKDAVMEKVEHLNVDYLLDTAEGVVTDEKKRRDLLSSATDSALDFLLRILPAMPVPPFDGVKEGIIYNISNLSMRGFRVKKEDIMVQIAGICAVEQSSSVKEAYSNTQSSSNLEVSPQTSSSNSTSTSVEEPTKGVSATELLVIDVRNISAVLEKAVWSFEQTYLPYLKGDGIANVRLSNGHIRLQFELRRKPVTQVNSRGEHVSGWEPVLCLHKRTCSIDEIELILEGEGRITWILNKLASIFKVPLRDYVVRVVQDAITNQSGWLLETFNSNLCNYWSLILRTAGLEMDDLVQASEEDIIAASPDQNANKIDLIWRDHVPLGMNLLMNDESGFVKVVDFPRGSQARKVALDKNIDPELFVGATIIAVNGKKFDADEQDELFDALRDPYRPKTVKFLLTDKEGAENVRTFVEKGNKSSESTTKEVFSSVNFSTSTIEIAEEGPLGIIFAKSIDNCCLVAKEFVEDGLAQLRRTGTISSGDLLTHINGNFVAGDNGEGIENAYSLLKSVGSTRPLSLGFTRPYLELVMLKKPSLGLVEPGGPEELVLEEEKTPHGPTRIILKGFREVDGIAESAGIFISDHLILVNGEPVGLGCKLLGKDMSIDIHKLSSMLKDPELYPMGLTFARSGNKKTTGTRSSNYSTFDIFSAETYNVSLTNYDQLGCVIGTGDRWDDFIVKSFYAVKGSFQQMIQQTITSQTSVGLAFESINGQVVPSYASCDMVVNALKRSWRNDGTVEILFCDDERKKWLSNIS